MKQSAGLLLYRQHLGHLEVLLVHPGGPFWKGKDAGAWSIPKGEFNLTEDGLAAAIRETKEETGRLFSGNFIPLLPIKQKNGKTVYAWVLETDFETATLTSNIFLMEWPPKSGKMVEIPEVDRAAWCNLSDTKEKINVAQWGLVAQLVKLLKL